MCLLREFEMDLLTPLRRGASLEELWHASVFVSSRNESLSRLDRVLSGESRRGLVVQ
jgi:hypothetical protein